MKIKLRGLKGMLVAALAVCMLLGIAQTVQAAKDVPLGINPNDYGHCKVFNNFWSNNTGTQGISLRTAVLYANKAGSYNSCYDLIEIESDNILMKTPLVIKRDGLVIDGDPHNTGSRATLDVKELNATEKTDKLDGHNCAIYIDALDVVIKNLKVSGANGQTHNGICFAGTDNMISNMKVTGGQYGIVFEEGSSGNRVLPDVKVTAISKFGLDDRASGTLANTVVMNNYKSVKKSSNVEKVDSSGFIDWVHQLDASDSDLPDYYDTPYFTIAHLLEEDIDFFNDEPTGSNPFEIALAGQQGLLKSKKKVMPLITEIRIIGEKKWEVKGFFKKVDVADDATEIPLQDCSGAPDLGVERMALFAVDSGKMQYLATVGMSLDFGVRVQDGTFRFYLDSNKNPELGSASSFILVPVNKQWQLVGRASEYKEIAEQGSDCMEGTGPDTDGGGTGNGLPGIQGFTSVEDCNEDTAFIPGWTDTTTDSDKDGIPDYIEMSVMWKPAISAWVFDPLPNDEAPADQQDGGGMDCDCGGKLSCWHKTDTDSDGIIDHLDDGTNEPWWQKFAAFEGDEPVSERTVIPVNTDASYTANSNDKPDVNDDDADDDGRSDGMEDRSMYWNEGSKAIFASYQGLNFHKYPNNDNPAECDLSVWGVEAVKNGIHWGIFKTGTGISKPTEFNMWNNDTIDEGQQFEVLACINNTVVKDTNYNGEYNANNGETNARDIDTDHDCVCDFGDQGCKDIDGRTSPTYGNCFLYHSSVSVMDNPLYLNDGCPEKVHPDNQCSPDCVEGLTIEWMKFNAPDWLNSAQDALKDDDPANGVPDLFEQTYEETDADTGVTVTKPDLTIIAQNCSNFDQDGIPDCVESPDGKCENTVATPRLNPFARDTDEDGFVDGRRMGDMKADVCPFTPPLNPSQSDDFTPVNPHYTCDPRQDVYASPEVHDILACFLDRDGDGVSDCEEDKDMNGQPAAPIHGIEGILLSESNPLKVDTDDDGLSDYKEMIGKWPYRTNPSLADTDGDGLDDPEEDRDGNGIIEKTILEGQGCRTALEGQYDTDPRYADTDGDTLSDFQEIFPGVMDDDVFRNEILNMEVWMSGGIAHASSPVDKDSDGDGLDDNEEYNGEFITYFGSNPCMIDSDGDGVWDKDELPGCRLNPDLNCIGSEDGDTSGGLDSDSDGLPDGQEILLGTDPHNWDSDGDNVSDGIEVGPNGRYEPSLGETNPFGHDLNGDGIADGYDTDLDGLNDGLELRYGTDPTNIDSDSDCIADGIEDANLNGQYDMGVETDARSSDTDGDGLPDGWVATSGMGEDVDCDGIRDQDADGRYIETDPRNPDSDMDGIDDFTEMWHDGVFNLNNIDRATTGRSSCSLLAGAAQAPSGMMLLIGLALAIARVIRRKDETPA